MVITFDELQEFQDELMQKYGITRDSKEYQKFDEEFWVRYMIAVKYVTNAEDCKKMIEQRMNNIYAPTRTQKIVKGIEKLIGMSFIVWFISGGGWFFCCVLLWMLWFSWDCCCNGGARR